MAVIKQGHSGARKSQASGRELEHGRFARKAAAQGMVLLKNQGMLPLAKAAPLALFGGGAVKTVKGGTGSGDVNSRRSVSIYEGLRDAGAVLTDRGWIADYEARYEAARAAWKKCVLEDVARERNPFDAYAANPFVLPEGRKITEEDIKGASAVVYVISRIAGEGKDRRRREGDYDLSKREREELLWLDQTGIPILLLVNAGGPVELAEICGRTSHIGAILYVSLPGQEGGHAVADVLFGDVTPGGRLAATWARRYEDYPFAADPGCLNRDPKVEEYREGIYVGYRYFDTFGVRPLFPFGYGLSYTEFALKYEGMRRTEVGLEITVLVKNTGTVYSGREVVQVYATPPQTGRTKEYRRLVGFEKTGELSPGGEERLVILVEQFHLASFAEGLQAWVVEAGTYGIWIGRHLEDLALVGLLDVEQQTVLEEVAKICPGTAAFAEAGASQTARDREREWLDAAKEQGLPRIRLTPRRQERNVYRTPVATEQPVEELLPLLYGNITKGTSMLGSAGIRVPGSAGETTEALEEKYQVRSLIMADGPAGLRLRQIYEVDRKTDAVYGGSVLGSLENGFLEEMERHDDADTYHQYCTAFPVGTALAQTWDRELLRKFGQAVAVEMEEFHVDLWLGPGMNIQRDPLCGRNFEYYSEDPLLSGILAAAVTDGVQSHKNCGVTLKHFACNNREDDRMDVDVRISQRALREIYLRGFEIAVKKSRPVAMMSSYNKINGVHAANSRDLCTVAAREEWGFEGIFITDWNTTVPEDGSIPWKCAAAGNDIIMPGNSRDDEDIRRAYREGKLTEDTIRGCAGRILAVVRRLTG